MRTFLSWLIVITIAITIMSLIAIVDYKMSAFKLSFGIVALILGFYTDDFRKWLFNIK